MKFNVVDTERFKQLFTSRGASFADDRDSAGNTIDVYTSNATHTLRDAVAGKNAQVVVGNAAAHASNVVVTVSPAAGQTINGSANSLVLGPRQSVVLVSDGAGWRVTVSAIPQRALISRTTTYPVIKEDLLNFNTIMFTGSASVTATLVSAGSVGAGAEMTIKNAGTGTITVATASSQTIDGAASRSLAPNSSVTLKSTGAAWIVIASV